MSDAGARMAHTGAGILVILGTSRRRGNTRMLVDAVFENSAARIIDLADHLVGPYDYDNRHETDDFLALAQEMAAAEAIVFATPIYWYAMSAQLKTFFDRLSDLTDIHKQIGRRLAGKPLFAIATSSGDGLPPGFETPFAETAGYFNMGWGGLLHGFFREDHVLTDAVKAKAADFARQIM